MENEAWFCLLLAIVGWYWARHEGLNELQEEKKAQRTLAIQALYLNGNGEITDEEFDTHDRVAKAIDGLANATPSWLANEIGIMQINAGALDLPSDRQE